MCILANVTRTTTMRKVIAHKPVIGKKVLGKQSSPILDEQESPVPGEHNSLIETMMNS